MADSFQYTSLQMELRYEEVERARGIYERYIQCLPEVKSWVRYAKFEMKNGDVARARAVYERAVQELEGEAHMVRVHWQMSADVYMSAEACTSWQSCCSMHLHHVHLENWQSSCSCAGI